MLGKDKRRKFAKVLGTFGKANSGGADTSTPPAPKAGATSSLAPPAQAAQEPLSAQNLLTPTSTLPIEVVPLAMAETLPPPAPLDKGKGLVVVPSSKEEDTVEGPAFKRRRTTTVATSHSTSQQDAQTPRENPPSALTPPNYMALGEGAETNPEPTMAPPQELPLVVIYFLKGVQQTSPGDSSSTPMEENAFRSLGEFISLASSWREEAETKAKELALLQQRTADQALRWSTQEVAIKKALEGALKAETEANRKLHDTGQKYTELVTKLVPFHEQIVELTAAAEASKTHTSNLEKRCTSQEVNLGKVKGELAARNEAFNLLQTEFNKQTEALVAVQKELASQAKHSQRVEKELLEDGAHAFALGFEEALA